MIKNILVPLDGSEHSKAALEYAIWLTQGFHGTLFGLHVIDTVSIEGTVLSRHFRLARLRTLSRFFDQDARDSREPRENDSR